MTSNQLSSTDGSTRHNSEQSRDEVKEIQKLSQKETNRVRTWRLLLCLALTVAGVSVAITTYTLLRRQENDNFEQAYDQFAHTINDSMLKNQEDIREAMDGLGRAASSGAEAVDAKWPFYIQNNFESHARTAREHSGSEIFSIARLVTRNQTEKWLDFASDHYRDMVVEGHVFENGNLDRLVDNVSDYNNYISQPGVPRFTPQVELDYHWPLFEFSPPYFSYGAINWDFRSVPDYESVFEMLLVLKNQTLGTRVRGYATIGISISEEEHQQMHSQLLDSDKNFPHSFFFSPIHETTGDYESKIVGVVATAVAWDAAMRFLLPEGLSGIFAVLKNNCGQTFTYEIIGPDAVYIGEGDLHEGEYSHMKRHVDLAIHSHSDFRDTPGHCMYTLDIFPSEEFANHYIKNTPAIYAAVVAITFASVIVIFFVYDLFVQRRNWKLVGQAARSNAIVTSLFPGKLRDQVLDQSRVDRKDSRRGTTSEMKSFLSFPRGQDNDFIKFESRPLAEFFLETTIMFGDITGFTAWASVREPSQVFTLLETVYSSFDQLAKRRRVFKVETVGDCYVAVTGLPEPRADHAISMARFAQDCLWSFSTVVHQLEVVLGPDTADLGIRIGIHSGPVTAGVLRGERSRFQLFGDTMNTTARLESTSMRGRIQVSKQTAELVAKAGKPHWLQKRTDTVRAKGKGEIETYWLSPGKGKGDGDAGSETETSGRIFELGDTIGIDDTDHLDSRTSRLIDWNVETLMQLLKRIVARRYASRTFHNQGETRSQPVGVNIDVDHGEGETFLDEVKEIIELPEFDANVAHEEQAQGPVDIHQDVIEELRQYVMEVASLYRKNPFHSFEHASHVTMSVIKLMTRIVAPSDLDLGTASAHPPIRETIEDGVDADAGRSRKEASSLHDHTYGITSDPLTQFACAFAALIHDVDHTGVSNQQLIGENPRLAAIYKNRSVAEQNSLSLSWDLLMDPRFGNLRSAIFSTNAELCRFRELVVNAVMATDIVDKELKALRNARWNKAFEGKEHKGHRECKGHKESQGRRSKDAATATAAHTARDCINRKATIVIEHLIQASDVAHTMQHWHVYRKWNERLFHELYAAYRSGRAQSNPADFWAKGELTFFDLYIIPLAKKLKECGVFGVSGDEYLNYAMSNRQEWSEKGEVIVEEMVRKLSDQFETTDDDEDEEEESRGIMLKRKSMGWARGKRG